MHAETPSLCISITVRRKKRPKEENNRTAKMGMKQRRSRLSAISREACLSAHCWVEWGREPCVRREPLVAHCRVVQRHAYGATMVSVVLSDDLLTAKLPEARIVIGACSDQVGRVSAECAVPHPALMAVERGLQRERIWVAFRREVVAGRSVVRG